MAQRTRPKYDVWIDPSVVAGLVKGLAPLRDEIGDEIGDGARFPATAFAKTFFNCSIFKRARWKNRAPSPISLMSANA